MSFNSLLYCPDEKTATVVTQVLNELDFTVDRAGEAFAAVKRLTDEHFDALVVDCQDEQDASLLFKAARNSAHNSSSLSVAIVEGQAGVAKAFRIGANLVLTKPINVEQSKSTLRVARGLLRKGQPKPAPGASQPTPAAQTRLPQPSKAGLDVISPVPTPVPIQATPATPVASATLEARTTTPPPKAPVPFAGLVLEDEPVPATDAADAAVLESLPTISGKRPSDSAAPVLVSQTEPIAASTTGQAAAAARAPEKRVLGASTSTSPLVTNQPIVRDEPLDLPEPESLSAPSFSSLERAGAQSSAFGRVLKIAAVVAVVAAGGYFGFQKLKGPEYVRQLLQNRRAAAAPDTTQTAPAAKVESEPRIKAVSAEEQNQRAQNNHPFSDNSSADFDTAPPAHVSRQSGAPIETINVKEMPASRDTGKVVETPKPEPIQVRSGTAHTPVSQPAPPPVDMANIGSNENVLPTLVPPAAKLPMPAPGTVRVSQGVSQGLLLKKVTPVYPPMAQHLQREGTVQLLATISKYGEISKVQVLSGDPMLAKAAVDAVKQWEYRPYLLNGQPVEIETQINMVFKARQ